MRTMLLPWKRYTDFAGRATRTEFCMFTAPLLVLYAAISILATGKLVDLTDPSTGFLGDAAARLAILLLGSASVVPYLALQVRRFHDQNRSGWLVLVNLIPMVGSAAALAMMCLRGTPGPNRFGPDPR